MRSRNSFEATVHEGFSISNRGHFITVDIVRGTVAVGDRVSVVLDDGQTRVLEVEAVELVDRLSSTGPTEGQVALGLSLPEGREAAPGSLLHVVFPCPCCRCFTLASVGGFEVCPVCYWEDDGQHDGNADEVRGGPNGSLSLTRARQNYRDIGACDRKHINVVRPPNEDEMCSLESSIR